MTNKILILDFGSQVTKLIARRIREIGVYCEVVNHNTNLNEIIKFSPQAIILSGGPSSVNANNSLEIAEGLFDLEIPFLGICYGQQLISQYFGGTIEQADKKEFGKAFIQITNNHILFNDIATIGKSEQVWMSHGDTVTKIPQDFISLAKTDDTPYAIIANDNKKIYGIQFHPEVAHTPCGKKLLENFICKIAGCKKNWNMSNYLDVAIANIKSQTGNNKVICGLSGGVDSTVTAILINKAIGKNLTCIFVNNGLLRKNEAEEVCSIFQNEFDINFVYVDASKLFLDNLKDITDPETKRKIIGKTFIEVFDAEAKKITDAKFLAQGTLYPDVIESSHPQQGASATIKSHHNVGCLPEKMNLKLLEPLRELFKDEVRELGRELGIDNKLINRHPFPGPGLAIRIPGNITAEKIKILQEADAIYIEEIKNHNLYETIWQAFAVLLPVKTVGVMGDSRTYEYVIALRAVTSSDGMTADYFPFSHDFLGKVSNRIINEVRGVNRVTYDITSKPPGTIEWE